MNEACEFCSSNKDVTLTIYGESGKRSYRCTTHLNQPEDYKANPPKPEE